MSWEDWFPWQNHRRMDLENPFETNEDEDKYATAYDKKPTSVSGYYEAVVSDVFAGNESSGRVFNKEACIRIMRMLENLNKRFNDIECKIDILLEDPRQSKDQYLAKLESELRAGGHRP